MPAETKPLVKDEDGVAVLGCCSICQGILDQTLSIPSIAVLGTCYVKNTLTN